MRQSIGTLKPKFYTNGATFCGFTAAGVRRGYARVVDVVVGKKGKKRFKRRSKAANAGVAKTKMENPSFVGMVLERGRKASRFPGSAGYGFAPRRSAAIARAVGAVAGRDILGPARSLMSQAQRIYAEEILQANVGVDRLREGLIAPAAAAHGARVEYRWKAAARMPSPLHLLGATRRSSKPGCPLRPFRYNAAMLVFVDESGDAGMKLGDGSSDLFVATAVLFEDHDEASRCYERIDGIRAELKLSPHYEFHSSQSEKRVRYGFMERVAAFEFFYLAVVLEKWRLNIPVRNPAFQFKEGIIKYAAGLLFEHAKPFLHQAVVSIDASGSKDFRDQLAHGSSLCGSRRSEPIGTSSGSRRSARGETISFSLPTW